eukprot:6312805-Pyramimonas_sp.AAC.1
MHQRPQAGQSDCARGAHGSAGGQSSSTDRQRRLGEGGESAKRSPFPRTRSDRILRRERRFWKGRPGLFAMLQTRRLDVPREPAQGVPGKPRGWTGVQRPFAP